MDWPCSESCKQLQRFLGFVNFYRHFIRKYSTVAVSPTSLTSTKRGFSWMPEVDKASQELELDHPHPATARLQLPVHGQSGH